MVARSPQAKGQVEKRKGDLQRFLVVKLRLAGISTIEATNAFLPEFLARFNAKFRRRAGMWERKENKFKNALRG